MSTFGLCGLKPLLRRKCHGLEASLLQTVKKSKKPKKKHKSQEDKRKQTGITGISLFGAGKFVQKLMELQKKTLAFMDILDLSPCDDSTPLDELVMSTLDALQVRFPEVISSRELSKIEHASIEKGLDIFLSALKSLAHSWIEDGGMTEFKRQWPPLKKSSNIEELVEITMAMLDFIIKIASVKFDSIDEDDEEDDDDDDHTTEDSPEVREDFLMEYYLPEKVSSRNSSSPATPTSVLPHSTDYHSKGGRKFSCPSPLLYSLKVQALRRLKPMNRLSLPMFPRGEAKTNHMLDEMEESDMTEEPKRCNEEMDMAEVPRFERDETMKQKEDGSRVVDANAPVQSPQLLQQNSAMLSQPADSFQPPTPPRLPSQPPFITTHPIPTPPSPTDQPPQGTVPTPPPPPSTSPLNVEPQQNAESDQMPSSPKPLANEEQIHTPPPPPFPPDLTQLQDTAPIQMQLEPSPLPSKQPQNAAATQIPPPPPVLPQESGLTDEAPTSPSSISQASRSISTAPTSSPPSPSPASPSSGVRSVSEALPTSPLMSPKKPEAPPPPATPMTTSTAPPPPPLPTPQANGAAPAPPPPPPTQQANGASPAPPPPATPMTDSTAPPPPPPPTQQANGAAPAPPSPAIPMTNSTAPPPPPPTQQANDATPAPPPPTTPMTNMTASPPPPPPTQQANGAAPTPPPPTIPMSNNTGPQPTKPTNGAAPAPPTPPQPVMASAPPPPPSMQQASTAAPPPPPAAPNTNRVTPANGPGPPPPPVMPNSAAPPPPPPSTGKANGAGPPPPPGPRNLTRKKANSKLQRSSQVGNLYRTLKRKLEGSNVQSKSSAAGGTKNSMGASSGGKQGLADALVEMTQRSSYFQQIEEDIQKYSEAITKMKPSISNFQAEDKKQLLDFHKDVESVLEKLTDESQVLSKFEGFPIKKLEAIRMAAALYTKLDAIISDLQNMEVNCPLVQLLDKSERYFNKIKSEIDAVDRTKDEEAKKFLSHNIHFDFHILVKIKEAVVDVSSSCMELALKESHNDAKNNKANPDLLWKTFQFAFKVYSFAGGYDERAERLIKDLYKEIEVIHEATDDLGKTTQ